MGEVIKNDAGELIQILEHDEYEADNNFLSFLFWNLCVDLLLIGTDILFQIQ